MNQALAQSIQFATGITTLDSTNQKELQNLIAEYPFFAPAQLAYAAKLKRDGSFQLQTQLQKTGLFFSNARWLQIQLQEVDRANVSNNQIVVNNIPVHELPSNNIQSIVEEIEAPIIESKIENIAPVIEEIKMQEPKMVEPVIVEDAIENNFISNLNIPTVNDVKNIFKSIDSRVEKVEEVVKVEEVEKVKEVKEEVQEILKIEEPKVVFEEVQIKPVVIDEFKIEPKVETETISSSERNEIINETIEHSIINEKVKEELLPIEEIKVEAFEPIKVNDENDIHAQIQALKKEWLKTHSQEHLDYQKAIEQEEKNVEVKQIVKIEEVEKVEEVKEVATAEFNEESVYSKIEEKQATVLGNALDEWKKPTEDFANASFSFETENYYTIDYFASQGIKFDYAKEPQDKLTTRMLKFTDWLKKMRNTKYEPEIVEDPALEEVINKIATASNQSKEIVTETMAEVFAKQDKKEQAIQLYIKLSFLLPDKTTYFATKIKDLKGI